MKKDEVILGRTYAMKVSNKIVPVTVKAESKYGGWEGVNLSTSHDVRIRSAQKLRYEVEKNEANSKWSRKMDPNYASRKFKLVDKVGRLVQQPFQASTFDGKEVMVTGISTPRYEGSVGRIEIQYKDGSKSNCYPTVCGLKFVELPSDEEVEQ